MKNCILGLFLLLIMTACNTKNDSNAKNDSTAKNVDASYYSGAIGTIENGKYNIVNADAIEREWEASLKRRLRLHDSIGFETLEIIKVKTLGDIVEDCYILVAKTKGNSVTMSAILEHKGDDFYFMTKYMSGGKGYLAVICKGECKTGCYPGVRLQKDDKYLVCSSCTECEKMDCEMY